MVLMSEMPAVLIKLDLKGDIPWSDVMEGLWVGNAEILGWMFCVVVFFFPIDVNAVSSLTYFCPWSSCLVNK